MLQPEMPGDHPPIHLPVYNVYFSETTGPGDRVTGLPAMNFSGTVGVLCRRAVWLPTGSWPLPWGALP